MRSAAELRSRSPFEGNGTRIEGNVDAAVLEKQVFPPFVKNIGAEPENLRRDDP